MDTVNIDSLQMNSAIVNYPQHQNSFSRFMQLMFKKSLIAIAIIGISAIPSVNAEEYVAEHTYSDEIEDPIFCPTMERANDEIKSAGERLQQNPYTSYGGRIVVRVHDEILEPLRDKYCPRHMRR